MTVISHTAGETDDVIWSGEAPDRGGWLWGANWFGELPPANPTAANVRFDQWGAGKANALHMDRDVGSLTYAHSHVTELGGHTLTTDSLTVRGATVTLGPGTVDTRTLRLEASATLILAPETHLVHDPYIESIVLPADGDNYLCTLDLSGVRVPDGVLRLGNLQLNARRENTLILPADGSLHTLDVLGDAELPVTTSQTTGMIGTRIGVEALGWKLPAGMHLRFGREAQRGNLTIGKVFHWPHEALLAASSGGSFIAWLDTLEVGRSQNKAANARPWGQGTLDLTAVDTFSLDAHTVNIGVVEHDVAPDGSPGNRATGTVKLPAGPARAGTVVIGCNSLDNPGANFGRLELYGTTFEVTGSLTVKGTGSILVEIDDASAGLLLPNDPDALVVEQVPDGEGGVAIQGSVTVRFTGSPQGDLRYGLRWGGDRRDALQALLDDGCLVIDSSELTSEAVIFTRSGFTHIGFLPSRATLLLIR